MRSGFFDAQDVLASALPQEAAFLADVPLPFEQPLLKKGSRLVLDLPELYKQQMKELLTEDAYQAFINTYTEPPVRGLRTNTLKVSPEVLTAITPFHLERVDWCSTGFYYNGDDRPGKHPYYDAGLYYIQEPSAMAVVELLDPQPGEWVLDLCAAPGGKSTHIAAKMNGTGWLVANDIHSQRVKVLTENLERSGARNTTILNASPQQLSTLFTERFDRILVDAPCSGEGMFRKNPDAVNEWSPDSVNHCEQRQRDILASAIPMLRPGGRLVYSTCTFNTRENEAVIAHVLQSFPALQLIDVHKSGLFAPGFTHCDETAPIGNHVARLWPHIHNGEGHFVAVIEKRAQPDEPDGTHRTRHSNRHKLSADFVQSLNKFESTSLVRPLPKNNLLVFGTHLYESHPELPDLAGIKVARPGFHLGTFKKNRFEPSHALAMALTPQDVQQSVSLTMERPTDVEAYLRGETVHSDREQKGWVLVTVDGFPLGWGKQTGTQVKNHLPKRLRKQ